MSLPTHEDHDGRQSIEPRIARLETGLQVVTRDLESVGRDLRDVAAALKNFGDQADARFERLSVLITEARAPKKIEWQTILAGIALIMSIGVAAIKPLYDQDASEQQLRIAGDTILKGEIADRRQDLERQIATLAKHDEMLHDSLGEHAKLKLHPVGEARIDALEDQVAKGIDDNRSLIKTLHDEVVRLETKAVPDILGRLIRVEQGK